MGLTEKLKAENQCRQCERPTKGIGGRQLTKHRLVPGRLGGRYIAQNVVPLCRPCHDDVEEQDPLARKMLRPKLWPVEIAHILEELGADWFEAMYPKPAAMEIERRRADALARAGESRRRRPTDWLHEQALVHERKRKAWDPDLAQIASSEKSSARLRGTRTATTNS